MAEKIRILHVGDAGKFEQIKPSARPDVFMPHVSVGLDIKKCAEETIKPKLILMSNLIKLGHPSYKWRHPLSLGLKKMRLHKRSNGDNAVLGRMRRSRVPPPKKKAKKLHFRKKSAKHALFGILPLLQVDGIDGQQKRPNKPCFEARFFWQKRKIFNFSKTRRDKGAIRALFQIPRMGF